MTQAQKEEHPPNPPCTPVGHNDNKVLPYGETYSRLLFVAEHEVQPTVVLGTIEFPPGPPNSPTGEKVAACC